MANYYEIMKILGLGEDKINKNGLKKKGKCEAIFFLKILSLKKAFMKKYDFFRMVDGNFSNRKRSSRF